MSKLGYNMSMSNKNPKRLQVQISEELYSNVSKRSNELGFESVNQVVKLMLQGFANNKINFGFSSTGNQYETVDNLTKKNILKSLAEIKNGEFVEVDMNNANALDSLNKLWED